MKKEFDSEPVYNKEYLKAKIKSHGDEVTDFYDKEISKLGSNYTCLVVISFDSEKKVNRHINDNLSDFPYCSGESNEE